MVRCQAVRDLDSIWMMRSTARLHGPDGLSQLTAVVEETDRLHAPNSPAGRTLVTTVAVAGDCRLEPWHEATRVDRGGNHVRVRWIADSCVLDGDSWNT